MVYYLLITVAVIMFGIGFALDDTYRKLRGADTVKVSVQYSFITSLPSLLFLLIINGFKMGFTPFTLLMAFLNALNGFAFIFCSFKALGSINLSLYSLFSMFGGMALPFLQGILFYDEPMTLAKGICLLFLCAAMVITIEKGENRKGGFIYYAGIFILNGMSGVLAKLFTDSPYPKADSASYTMLSAAVTFVLSGIILLFMRKVEAPKVTPAAAAVCIGSGMINRVANYFLLIGLVYIPASVQSPFVTGGVIISSTAICFFGKNKPRPKEIISIALACVGILALIVIPI